MDSRKKVVMFVDSLGYREITLKSDTEPATIAFRNRVAEWCRPEVTTEDAVKGETQTLCCIEVAVMQWRGVMRTVKLEGRSHRRFGTRRKRSVQMAEKINDMVGCHQPRDCMASDRSVRRGHRGSRREYSLVFFLRQTFVSRKVLLPSALIRSECLECSMRSMNSFCC